MRIIRLHTLSARAPSMQDAYKVAELIHICDANAFSLGQHHEEEIKAAWQRPRFQLMSDAWIIARMISLLDMLMCNKPLNNRMRILF